MTVLGDALERWEAVKQEHVRDDQRVPGPRPSEVTDIETLVRLVPPGVDALELWVFAEAHIDAILRDLKRAGQLRGANRKALRATLFAAWLDGAGLGLHYGAQT